MTDLFSEIEWRGMVHEATDGAADTLRAGAVTCYIGFDPTASSLHVGSLLPVMALARAQRFGHHPIAVAGGGTGLIGDPSGKTLERKLLSVEEVNQNVEGIRKQLARFLDFDLPVNPARIVNNGDWLTKLDLMSFLRDVGKHFTVNYMLAKESVKSRVASTQRGLTVESESGQKEMIAFEGMSFTEFSYMLLQSYDFLTLFDRYGCTLQMGGSDQWGNITAGIDLIRRLRRAPAYGLVMPLVTTSSGMKFGKTEAGAVWLDPARTSPYRFYQFWLNTADRDVVPYLKYFTFLTREEIEELTAVSAQAPESRTAQRRLASEVTRLVHGDEGLASGERATAALFGGGFEHMTKEEVLEVLEDVPRTDMHVDLIGDEGRPITELLASVALAASKGDATRLIRNGGVYLNDRQITDERARVRVSDSIDGCLLILRRGKKQYHVIKLIT